MDALTTVLGALAILLIGIFLDRTFPTISHLFLIGALSLVFGIVLFFIKNKYGREPKDIFPLLKRDALEKWGIKWGQQYDYLKRVVLYGSPMDTPSGLLYILYFEFNTLTDAGKQSENIFSETIAFSSEAILTAGFEEVYKKEPDMSFRDEWYLVTNTYNGNYDEKYSWVIYK
jgi:hypothetical protein